MCTFTGPAAGGTPGRCTGTPDFLSNAEIKEIVRTNPSAKKYVAGDDSDILVYDNTNWVSWLDDARRKARVDVFRALNLGGTVDWAIDLQDFV